MQSICSNQNISAGYLTVAEASNYFGAVFLNPRACMIQMEVVAAKALRQHVKQFRPVQEHHSPTKSLLHLSLWRARNNRPIPSPHSKIRSVRADRAQGVLKPKRPQRLHRVRPQRDPCPHFHQRRASLVNMGLNASIAQSDSSSQSANPAADDRYFHFENPSRTSSMQQYRPCSEYHIS